MKIKKGQIVVITKGEYSDYGLYDHLRALRDFDAYEEAERFKVEGEYLRAPEWDQKGEPGEYGSDDRFLAWLLREGIMEPTKDEVVELWIGGYGSLEVSK